MFYMIAAQLPVIPGLESILHCILETTAGVGLWNLRPHTVPTKFHVHAGLSKPASQQSGLQDAQLWCRTGGELADGALL